MAKRSRMRYPLPLASIARAELNSLGLGERLREAEIWRLWPEVVGEAIAGRAMPVRIIKGVLTVAVSSGPWKQELTFLKGLMIEKLNSQLGKEVVREIVLKPGRVDIGFLENIETDLPEKKKRLNARQLTMVNEQSAHIADAETREAFKALMKASLRSNSRN